GVGVDLLLSMEHSMRAVTRTIALVLVMLGLGSAPLAAQANPPPAQANPPPPPAQAYPPPPPAQANPAPPPSGAAPQGPQKSSNEIADPGHRFFGTISRGPGQIVEKAGANLDSPTATCWDRKPAARWSPGCVTAKASSTPRTPAISGSSGKGLRS